MKSRFFWTAGLLLVLLAWAAIAAWFVWLLLAPDPSLQKAREARPLVFDPPAQPDSAGPVRIRFDCPARPERDPITVKVYYIGVSNEAGRSYANETNELLLGPVYAPGTVGQIVTVPGWSFDRRVRGLVTGGQIGAEIYVHGREGLNGFRLVDQDEISDVVGIECETKAAETK